MRRSGGERAVRSARRGRGAIRLGLHLARLLAPLALLARPAPAAPDEPIGLLVLGDSLAAGYGLAEADGFEARLAAALAAEGKRVRIIDGAVPGDTAAGGLARLDWLMAEHPKAALVELGANDGLRGEDPAVLERNLGAILDRLAAAHIPVLLAGMYAPPNMGSAYAERFRAVYLHLAARPGVIFEPFFLEGVAGTPALNQADGMHPNAAGEARVVAAILAYVEKLLAEVKE